MTISTRVRRSKRRNRHRVIHSIERNIQAINEGPARLKEVQPVSRERRQEIGRELNKARLQVDCLLLDAKEIAIADIAEGVPIDLVARELGLAKSTVHKWIKEEK